MADPAAPVGLHVDVHPLAVATTWRGHAVLVEARLIPRYLWTSANITVAVDGNVVLQTGGQRKMTGGSRDSFELDGARHDVELTWDVGSAAAGFPVRVTIDGEIVLEDAPVAIANPAMSMVGVLAIGGVAALVALLFLWMGR